MGLTIGRSTDAVVISCDVLLAPHQIEDEPRTIVHEILGATYPDVTLRPAASATTRLLLAFDTEAAAEAARVFHRVAATFTITTDIALVPSRYVPQGRTERAQYNQNLDRWVLTVNARELAP